MDLIYTSFSLVSIVYWLALHGVHYNLALPVTNPTYQYSDAFWRSVTFFNTKFWHYVLLFIYCWFYTVVDLNRCISIIFWFCCCNLWKFSASFSSFVFGIWTYYQYLNYFLMFYKISYQELEAWPENFHHNWINNVLYIYNSQCFFVDQSACFACS